MDANDLLATASARYPMDKHVDLLSGSWFERAVIDGEPYVVKHLGWERDWIGAAGRRCGRRRPRHTRSPSRWPPTRARWSPRSPVRR